MAFKGGTNNSTYILQPVASVYPPVTMACWFWVPVSSSQGSQADYWFLLYTEPTGLYKQFAPHYVATNTGVTTWGTGVIIKNAGTTSYDYTPSSAPIPVGGTWNHFAFTADDGGTPGQVTTPMMYLNGVFYPPVFTYTPVTGLNVDDAGTQLWINTGSVTAQAAMAFPSIWKTVLTASQIAQLAKGLDPRWFGKGLDAFSLMSGDLTSPPDLVRRQNYVLSTMDGNPGPVPFTAFPNPRVYLRH